MTQMKQFAVRLSDTAISEMQAMAESRYMPTRTMVRSWVMERLEAEQASIQRASRAAKKLDVVR